MMKLQIELPESWGPQDWAQLQTRLRDCIEQEVQRAAPRIAAAPDTQAEARAAIALAVQRAFAADPGGSA
ncbi:hypothetical protein HNP55_001436 [Paucibacter oligotrophus]|uniref:Uncharacterized protein n=1 Tax=Roseateles oligotrophus TaxID=1769250 RepID=A0A840L557_9BURK|nr:hypothetical protein [Roseateles oligotrophus]MBB4842921.1 hypothetical protein [Roseateles oligotrophus]